MSRPKTSSLGALQRKLSGFFTPKPSRRADPHRKARERAKQIAQSQGIEIERLDDGGFNVWPPTTVADADDPFKGDHFASDWGEVLSMVEAYAKDSSGSAAC